MLIIGSYVSPYVRKVLACLALKGVAYDIDPITPFYGDDRFEALSPLRRIPVLVDGDLALSDSSVICQYLEERYPTPSLFPATAEDRARARWLEEFADTRMGDVFVWSLLYALTTRRAVWGEAADKARAETAVQRDAPLVLDYLERQAPADGFLFGDEIGLADISVASFLRSAELARFSVDAARWPKTAAHVGRVLAHPALAALRPFEELSMRTPIPAQREALAALGAPLSRETYAAPVPRRGVMTIEP